MNRIVCLRAFVGAGVLAAMVVATVAIAASSGGITTAHAARDTRSLVAVSQALAASSPTIPAKVSCASLGTDPDFVTIRRNPTAIASATDVPAANGSPTYCDVKGMIAPQTHFELKLPESTWQGRYLQNGCGGYCGNVPNQNFPSCDAALGGDFAMAADDEGHTSSGGLGGGGLFAFNSSKLRKVYGYQSEQSLYIVARALIRAYYGQDPNSSYYDGCSDGGREAMEMAERYPDDFNGILAGAPEIYAGPLNAENQTWDYRVNTGADGNAILTSDKLPALHAAVLKFCAGDDGTDDGIIQDPQDCDSKVSQILAGVRCPPGVQNSSCLTPAQANVARLYWQGPADPRGRALYPGGMPLGSELGWTGFALPPGGSGPMTKSLDYSGLSLPYLRFQLLRPGRLGPDPSQWRFTDRAFRSMFPAANIWDALSTDLRAFRAHGGKLIMWQGFADNGIPPSGTVTYYDALTRRMGGLARTQRFSRLFMFPTVYHCGGGYGGVSSTNIDMTLQLVQWVESGVAPTEVDVNYPNQGVTRPVYPYPNIPHYNGRGDPNQPSSFHPVVAPAHAQHSDYKSWIGSYLFDQPIGGGSGRFDRRSRP